MKRLKTTIIKIIFLLLFITPKIFFSQEILKPTNEKTYTEYMDKVLEPLIKNDSKKFKNEILYDRVYPMAKLDIFNDRSVAYGRPICMRQTWNTECQGKYKTIDRLSDIMYLCFGKQVWYGYCNIYSVNN